MAIITNETKVKLATYRDEFLAVHPNEEMIVDPNYVVTGEPDEVIPMVNKYTDSQWIDIVVKRFLTNTVKKGKKVLLEQSAQAIDVVLE